MSNITNQEIVDAAKAPQNVSTDGVSVTNRSTKELIEARDAVANDLAARTKRRGMLFSRHVPGSAVGE